jgi:chemotaxis family two-component system response regulator Rcp1
MLLLVEDNPADIVLLREALKESPVPVQLCTVRDGTDALAFLQHEDRYREAPRPDLIVLDLNLPRKSGREVLAQVKSDASLKCIPVVILSSSTEPGDIEQSYELGANVYVRKPVDLEEYFATIRDLVGFWCQRAVLPSEGYAFSYDVDELQCR